MDSNGELLGPDQTAALARVTGNEDPYEPRMGRPLAYNREVIERCLYETAVHAGNARKARRALVLWEPDLDWPSHEQMYTWIKGRFRNRYSEICTREVDSLREVVARNTIELAVRIAEVEGDALRRVDAQLADANGVEASMILRNLTTSKDINLRQEAALRGRAGQIVEHRGLDELMKALVNVGVADYVDSDVVDADVVEP